jgi:hypothetical protein
MDSATFDKHFRLRHTEDEIAPDNETAHRAFHRRIHSSLPRRVKLDHSHDAEALDEITAAAIRSLIENGNRGWFEIAGTPGLVSCAPDGRIKTMAGDVIQPHGSPEEAALYLTGLARTA